MGLMLLVTAGAASAEWTGVGENDEFIQYVDLATIRRNGNFVKMWHLMDHKTVQKDVSYSYLSSKTQSEFDCKEKKRRTLAFTLFGGKMGNGKVVYSDSDARGKWSPIEPESVGETLSKIACGEK